MVIGVIGHVDHGKTTLVKHLTGVDTDRLPLEKERGMSIELGFAPLRLPSGQTISFVDVPGHEDYIKNAARGVSGVDLALLVVAADEGVRPQTVEHCQIAQLFGVRDLIAVITKTDLVDEELLELAEEDLRDFLSHTLFEGAPILCFSARTGEGKEDILSALQRAIDRLEERDQKGTFRLPIDRVFNVKGYGTVVTGTVVSGEIAEGEEVEVYPVGLRAKIRRLEHHGQMVQKAGAGQRVGVNLRGGEVNGIRRGMVLGRPKTLRPTRTLNARLLCLPDHKAYIAHGMRVRVYIGTEEVIARVVLMEKEKVASGESCFGHLRLEKEVAPLPFDRFVVRRLSPEITIGGGMVLEVDPPRYRPSRGEGTALRLQYLQQADYPRVIEEWLKLSRFTPLTLEEIAWRLKKDTEEVQGILEPLIDEGKVILLQGEVIHREAYQRLKDGILHQLRTLHEQDPFHDDFSKDDPHRRLSPSISQRVYDFALRELVKERKVVLEGGRIRLTNPPRWASRTVKEILSSRIEAILKRSSTRPLPQADLFKALRSYHKREVELTLGYLLKAERIIKLNNGRLLHAEGLEEIKQRVRCYISEKGRITLAEAKGLLGFGRTQIQPIFEYLDEIGFTVRVGDWRVLKEAEDGHSCGNSALSL